MQSLRILTNATRGLRFDHENRDIHPLGWGRLDGHHAAGCQCSHGRASQAGASRHQGIRPNRKETGSDTKRREPAMAPPVVSQASPNSKVGQFEFPILGKPFRMGSKAASSRDGKVLAHAGRRGSDKLGPFNLALNWSRCLDKTRLDRPIERMPCPSQRKGRATRAAELASAMESHSPSLS